MPLAASEHVLNWKGVVRRKDCAEVAVRRDCLPCRAPGAQAVPQRGHVGGTACAPGARQPPCEVVYSRVGAVLCPAHRWLLAPSTLARAGALIWERPPPRRVQCQGWRCFALAFPQSAPFHTPGICVCVCAAGGSWQRPSPWAGTRTSPRRAGCQRAASRPLWSPAAPRLEAGDSRLECIFCSPRISCGATRDTLV